MKVAALLSKAAKLVSEGNRRFHQNVATGLGIERRARKSREVLVDRDMHLAYV
jgi:hypothetical protein